MRFTFTVLSLATAALFAAGASAQTEPHDPLRTAVQKAVDANPEVTARFNAYRAAADAVEAARGGYYPRLDLNASVGRDRDTIGGRTPADQSISRTGASLTLSQLLWDGLATQKDIGRLGHDQLSRYFEVLDVTEQTALEAARAYYDVLRFRRLVQLAEDNFVQHQSAYNQIQSRFKAGVGRGVDLEQAGARLALAESNLNTEAANLHDVVARYQRVVGEAPPAELPLPTAFQAVPASAAEATETAIRRNPSISASVENLRSARALASVRDSAFQPKVEARLRSGRGKNFDGVHDQDRDASAEIVLNWNLFNGGADRARMRQQANIVNQAADLRDKACRDVRQTLSIAYNDTRKLVDQLVFLDRNTLAISKARDAYRQQFDIGQRSLLDLLNSENELYTAQRSYANAEYDLYIAYLRTHAAMNQLGTQLGLSRASDMPEAPSGIDGWAVGGDAPVRCPAAPVEAIAVDTAALVQRAASMTPVFAIRSATVQADRPAPGKTAAATQTAPSLASVQHRLQDWAAAWEAKDVDRYLAFYAPDFAPGQGLPQTEWKARRQTSLAKPGPISVKIDDLQVRELGNDMVETRFTQTYRSSNFGDQGTKTLVWKRLRNGQWAIARESNR